MLKYSIKFLLFCQALSSLFFFFFSIFLIKNLFSTTIYSYFFLFTLVHFCESTIFSVHYIFSLSGQTIFCKRGDHLLYLQLKARTTLPPDQQLLVHHVADALDTGGVDIMDLPVSCPQTPGVWRLPAVALVQAVSGVCPDVTILGPPECFVHVIPREKENKTHLIRTVLAFLLLMVGSALAITWFHADVNMLEAQQGLYRLITGKTVENTWLITIPYAIGVFFGVSLFYALLGKKGTTSPLEIKLEEYHQSAEQATGRIP